MTPKKIYTNREEAIIKAQAKLRGLGYSPINYYCEDMDYHHMHLNGNPNIGIFIPRSVHRSIYHDPTTGQGIKEINKAALLWLVNQDMISEDVNKIYKLGKTKHLKIESTISQESWCRIGKKGTSGDSFNDVLTRMLDMDDDINRILMFDEEPQTEKMKLIKRKWTK